MLAPCRRTHLRVRPSAWTIIHDPNLCRLRYVLRDRALRSDDFVSWHRPNAIVLLHAHLDLVATVIFDNDRILGSRETPHTHDSAGFEDHFRILPCAKITA